MSQLLATRSQPKIDGAYHSQPPEHPSEVVDVVVVHSQVVVVDDVVVEQSGCSGCSWSLSTQ